MRRPLGLSVLMAVMILPLGGATAAAADPGKTKLAGFVYQDGTVAPFGQSHTYFVHGTPGSVGCIYDYPDLRAPRGQARWATRDIAVNQATCTKLVEEGAPTGEAIDPLSSGGSGVTNVLKETAAPQVTTGSQSVNPLSIVTHSGYNHVWWEDVIGIRMAQDTTYLSWAVNGGQCVASGSASGAWAAYGGTGWALVSHATTAANGCAYYRGTTTSEFKNDPFCWPITVHIYFYEVTVYGWNDGTMGSYRNTRSANECAPFWMHQEVVQTT